MNDNSQPATAEGLVRFGRTSQYYNSCTLEVNPYTYRWIEGETTALAITVKAPGRDRDVETTILLTESGAFEHMRELAAALVAQRQARRRREAG